MSRYKNMIKHDRLLFVVGSLILSFIWSYVEAKPKDSDIVTEINGQALTVKQFNDRYQWYMDRFKFKMPKKDFLKNLIDLELSSQEAIKRGLDKDPKMLYDTKILLSQHLLEKEVYQKFEALQISDRDLKKYFEQSPEIKASHILFKLDPKADKAQEEKIRKEAQAVLKRAQAGENFAELAKKYSEGPSAKNGGDLDYFTRENMVPEFSDVAFKLKKVGNLSDLVRTKYGFHIIKLTGIRDFKSADKRRLQNQVKTQKQKEIYEGFFANLKKNAKIVVNEKLIED